MSTLESVRSPHKAATLLMHPLRPRILAAARQPVSAAELARRLGQPRQRLNYHVRQLASAGLLRLVGQQRKRNMVEQQYVASALAYLLTPDVLGDAAPQLEAVHEAANAAHLVTLCARAQSEVAQVMESADAAGLRVRTLSTQSEIRFESAEQRAAFSRELLQNISDVVARYNSSRRTAPFRLILGFYPLPTEPAM